MRLKALILDHTKWLCRYHIVFTPNYRRRIIFAELRTSIGEILRDLCRYKGVEMLEGHLIFEGVSVQLVEYGAHGDGHHA